jgi:hypothetical protein
MPRVRRKNVPPAVLAHLVSRIRERHVPVEDLENLARWLDTDPIVPSGCWFKRFAQIIVCGEGEMVKTILEDAHSAVGIEIE